MKRMLCALCVLIAFSTLKIIFVIRDLHDKTELQHKEIIFKINELQAMVKADLQLELVDEMQHDIVLEDILEQK